MKQNETSDLRQEAAVAAASSVSVDGAVTRRRLVVLSLQHVLVFYATVIPLPLIIANGVGLSPASTALLITAAVLAGGVGTIVQSVGVWKVGIRQPLILGGSAVAIGPVIAIANSNGGGTEGLAPVFGATIAAGAVLVLISPLYGRILRLMPPVVIGSIILVVGLSLLPIAAQLVGGGDASSDDFARPEHLMTAGATLVTIVTLYRFGRGLLKGISILLGLLVGGITGYLVGVVDLSPIGEAAWFGIVGPFEFGLPTFDVGAIIVMSIVLMVVGVECISSYYAVSEITGRTLHPRDITRGILAEGFISMFSGVFNAVSATTFNGNVGIVQSSKAHSRWITALAGALIVVLAFFPKMSAVAAALPKAAVGIALLTLFGIIATVGIKILSAVDLKRDSNLIVVAVSVSLGFIPVSYPDFFHVAPEALRLVLHSGIVVTAVVSVVLNLVFNGLHKSEE